MRNYGYCFRTYKDGNLFIEHEDYYEMIVYYKEDKKHALISKESYDNIKKYNWHLRPDGYIEASVPGHSKILLHRYLTNFKFEYVDHINRNKLDNRLNNLREATLSQNQMNKSMMSNNTSGITGVSWDKNRNKWHVMISINGKNINIGRFDEKEDAIKARLEAEKKYHKEYTPINRKGEYIKYE